MCIQEKRTSIQRIKRIAFSVQWEITLLQKYDMQFALIHARSPFSFIPTCEMCSTPWTRKRARNPLPGGVNNSHL